MKISIITPTVRPEGLPIMARCLKRQDFTDWEWIISAPKRLFRAINDQLKSIVDYRFVPEPPKQKGDFYRLCGAWNVAFREAEGELFISLQDWIWFPPDTLSRFWRHYQANPKAIIAPIGHHYQRIENDKPEEKVWQDPRARLDQGTFYEVAPTEVEFSLCSLPKRAIYDCGGIDEDYDKGPAVGEKEMCWRLDNLGYKFFLDQTLEYRALHHPRLTEDWDEKYFKISAPLLAEHIRQIKEGTRKLNVGYIS